MIKVSFLILFVLVFHGCSFKTPPNQWQYKSANAFASYTKNFLEGNDVLAKNDLSRAISHAKKSANLHELAKIYLGECALNISVGIADNCEKYKNIQELIANDSLDAYYALLTKTLSQDKIKYLPKQYQAFANNFFYSNGENFEKEILSIDKTTSSLLCAALAKESLTASTRLRILEKASFYGYKKSVHFWLLESLQHETDKEKKHKLQKKINILN